MPEGRKLLKLLSSFRRLVAMIFVLMVLWRLEPKVSDEDLAAYPHNKLMVWFPVWIFPEGFAPILLLCLHGGGRERTLATPEGGFGRLGSFRCTEHTATVIVAVIFGRYGDPISTSCVEALRILRQSSSHLGSQVVRPRHPRSGRWLDLSVGMESSSNLLSDLGGKALRSPVACGGGVPLSSIAFLFFCLGGFL
jgi:hypothetical protein